MVLNIRVGCKQGSVVPDAKVYTSRKTRTGTAVTLVSVVLGSKLDTGSQLSALNFTVVLLKNVMRASAGLIPQITSHPLHSQSFLIQSYIENLHVRRHL
jgi:hypothetical protein